MTSKGNTECFVYITLPGETEAVTAGRFQLTPDRRGNAVGRFVYGKSYLARGNAVAIDPVELKLSGTTYETGRLNGVFGALRDAGPDYWGRRVIEKHAGVPQLGELDYLLNSADDRAGALGFGLGQQPPAPRRKFNQTLELAKLQAVAEALMREENVETEEAAQVQDLMLLGTSMGGARPKSVVEDDRGLWVAKFNRPDDRWNNTRVERAMLELARLCGIRVAESAVVTVGGKDVLLVKRFDRTKTEAGYQRSRMISGLTLLQADEAPEMRDRWSYVLMAEELRRVVQEPQKDAKELFRRMTFNALISNLDDHPRNHALVAKDNPWQLSPAYDLTPSPVIAQERRDLALEVGDQGRFANAKNVLSQHARFLLDADEAKALVSTMTDQVRASWYDVVRGQGVTEKDAETITGAFVYPGFST
ncbi:type II toxin-antitoxin system HipA family toxin [Bradyrhizobium tropiciagri]|uniref:type II toxin-antitoxin system HipA family toxin n=1 Tax=Bradyrhizobium tropiciagri TaxID=312253 RepID=UPI001BADD878|nr:HipA domain-containing protein [Bradyrhizobium tropiciagri]MBR0899101.1 type II toxin-antitoxin system HipA family toxin [Bradyrhizobium tropiciagri]